MIMPDNMKKILVSLSVILFTIPCIAQSGDGSSGNPFYGTISNSVHWSVGDPIFGSTVYIGTSGNPDLTVGTGGHLTIDPGITVIFTQLTSDLFITGTGQLTAGGTGSQVIFTKDASKSHWGHISFQNMGTNPASSTFNNCLFQYGYSTGTSGQPLLAGGAIQIDFNDVVISDCAFENNYANYAGAIMINSGRNAVISNSYFKSNSVFECGGAIILYANSTALVEDCIFESNYSKGNTTPAYSGGAIWSYSNTSKVINCTFAENTSDRPGDAFYSYSSSGIRIINSIFWGSNDQFAGSTNTSTIVTCAFEAAKPANAANSIIISDVADDHFVNAGNSDWTLKFISPCRDAGSIPTPAVPTDYIGNSRIGPYDIGAYEVQYSYWKTTASSTDWNTSSNWDGGIPSGSTDVVIPAGASNYPVDAPGPDFTLGTGKYMILEPGSGLTMNSLTNNGTLELNASSSGFASLILGSYSRGAGGTEEIQIYLTGGGDADHDNFAWHYISTPVSSLAVSTFAPGITQDLAQFIESRPVFSLIEGWVAYDGYIYSNGHTDGPTFSTLTPGKGYDFWDNTDNTVTFSGTFNTSDVIMSLPYGGTPSLNGFNLLGNPFSSGLDWDDIVDGVYSPYPSNTSKGLYFTRDNAQCSYISGVGVPGDVTGIIPPMQGFFTKTYSTGNSITLPAAARTNTGIHARYKGKSLIPLVRLQLADETEDYDETVVRFDISAKSTLDNDFDAVKMLTSTTKNLIYTSLNGTDYAINGQPFPELSVEIPVVINITASGNYKISSTQLQGLYDYNVTLLDNDTGFPADLNSNPVVTFSSSAGTFTGRFSLIVSKSTAIETPGSDPGDFSIYPYDNMINIIPLGNEWSGVTGSVSIIDLSGKLTGNYNNIEFRRDAMVTVRAPQSKGLYFVEIRSGLKRYVGKIVIK